MNTEREDRIEQILKTSSNKTREQVTSFVDTMLALQASFNDACDTDPRMGPVIANAMDNAQVLFSCGKTFEQACADREAEQEAAKQLVRDKAVAKAKVAGVGNRLSIRERDMAVREVADTAVREAFPPMGWPSISERERSESET